MKRSRHLIGSKTSSSSGQCQTLAVSVREPEFPEAANRNQTQGAGT
jgi:hypothetical protein